MIILNNLNNISFILLWFVILILSVCNLVSAAAGAGEDDDFVFDERPVLDGYDLVSVSDKKQSFPIYMFVYVCVCMCVSVCL